MTTRRLLRQRWIYLELTPPARTDKTLEATQRLFSVLYGLDASRSLADRLFRRDEVFTLEVVSTRELGIRYLMRVSEINAPVYEHTITSYLPDIRYRRVEDILTSAIESRRPSVLEFRQTGHFAYPLQVQESLAVHDPIAYMTGTMTKLAPGEIVAIQMVVTPSKIGEAAHIAQRILGNEEMLQSLGNRKAVNPRTNRRMIMNNRTNQKDLANRYDEVFLELEKRLRPIWQGWQSVDQTFEDEIEFEVEEIRQILDEPIVDEESSC